MPKNAVIKKTKATKEKILKFPCLIEVIFEIKWQLQEVSSSQPIGPNGQINFNTYDPAFFSALSGFEKEIKKIGFKDRKDINPILPHIVTYRYFKKENQKFPILQIGQGIYAANADAETYEWKEFKSGIIKGLESIINNYPNKLHPVHIELRYINLFDSKYLSSADNISFSRFLEKETLVNFKLPDFSFSKRLKKREDGRIIIQKEITDMAAKSQFIIDLSSAKKENSVDSIRLESKILTNNEMNAISYKGKLPNYISTWLDEARSILSPFFKEFINQDLREKLEGKKVIK